MATTRITPTPNGPLPVTGQVEIEGTRGAVVEATDAVYLCRCGRSADKPFCDGSHARAGWSEDE